MILSIMTMTEYYPEIWNDASFPSDVDSQDLIDRICLDCAEIELLYSDPAILKYMIRNWCRTEAHVWEKLADTLNFQYNPIYNLDVTYEETRTPNLTHTRTPNLTETRTPNLTSTRTPNITATESPNTTETRTPNLTEEESPTDTTTEAVAGFNAATFENARQSTRGGKITTKQTGNETIKNTGSIAHKTTGTETTKETGTDTRKETGTDTTTETGTETVNVQRYGNQGVTMTQDMIEREREVSLFNLYDYIVKSFKNRFCLLVY